MQPSSHLDSSTSQAADPVTEITIKLTPFDQKEYRALIDARDQTLRRMLKRLKSALGLSTAVDAGCGVGFFSQTLAECGLCTCGFDARGKRRGGAQALSRNSFWASRRGSPRDFPVGSVRPRALFRPALPPRESVASHSKPSRHHREVSGAGKYVPAGRAMLPALASGAAARRPEPY